jgi:hypothetical protein
MFLMGVSLAVSAEAAIAQKLNVTIIDRRDSATNYAYTAPAYFHSRSDSSVTCYGDVSCSGSTTTTGSISPPRSVSYQVRGATFTLQLPDGRGVVVNCESKYQPKFDYINRRDCRMPLVDNIEAEFHGNSAKLSWAVSLDGKKMQSETYRVLAILESNGIAPTNASQAKTLQSNPSQAAKSERPASSTPVPTDKVTTAMPVAAPVSKSFTVQSVEPSRDGPSATAPNSAQGWIGVTAKSFGSGCSCHCGRRRQSRSESWTETW